MYVSITHFVTIAVQPVLRGHIWDKEKVVLQFRWPLKRRFNSYEIVYDRTRKVWPFNTDDLIELTGGQAWLYLCFKMNEWLLYSANTTLIFQLSLQVHVLLYKTMILPVLSWTNTMSYNRVEGWNFINRFDPTTLVCLFKVCTWIANVICFMDFWVQWFQVRCGCLFCWCWWNCWPSLYDFLFLMIWS